MRLALPTRRRHEGLLPNGTGIFLIRSELPAGRLPTQKGGTEMRPAKNTICLWFDGGAEEAARFYAETFPDSFVGEVHRAPSGCV